MRLHRFYSDEMIEPRAVGTLSRYPQADQWRKVFRFKRGDQAILFDGSGFDFVCEIENYDDDDGASVRVIEVRKNEIAPKRETILCAAIVKKDTFEWIVQKATELGVSQIVPIIAERSEKKNLNFDRLRKIVIEAAEQSGRGTLPVLHEAVSFEEAVTQGFGSDAGVTQSIAWEPSAPVFRIAGETGKSAADSADSQREMPIALSDKVITYIGPEGGWSETELSLFSAKGITVCSMGPQVLRAETAVVAALALVTFL